MSGLDFRRALAPVAWGYVVVLVDLRINHLDLLHDLVGWGLCLVGLTRLPAAGWFTLARIGAGAGLLAALPDLLNPPNGWIVTTLESIAQTGLVVGTCLGLAPLLAADRARAARWIAGLWLALEALLLLTWAAFPDDTPQLVMPWGVLLLVGAIALAIWFIVFLFQCSREASGPDVGSAVPTGDPA